jgi:hypothetical protein
LHDGELARLPDRKQRLERRVQPAALVELQHLVAAHGEARPQPVVRLIGVRHHRVQPVVAALELDEHQQSAVRRGLSKRRSGKKQRGYGRPKKVSAVHFS